MADKFSLDFGSSTLERVKRMSEEEARFQGMAPVEAPTHARECPSARLIADGESLGDAIASLIARDDRATMGLTGCERIDTHIRRDHKQRMKVFCATHGLTMRQVMAIAFEAVVAAMDEYDSKMR